MEKAVIKIDGMTCAHCEKNVQDSLLELAGVASASADRNLKQAEVVYDPNVVTPAKMAEVINDIGFTAELF